jgi:hypothetical protein
VPERKKTLSNDEGHDSILRSLVISSSDVSKKSNDDDRKSEIHENAQLAP